MSTLYHASSHCWAKVFVLPQKDAYAYAKGRKWNERVSQKAMELAMNSEDGYNEGMLVGWLNCAVFGIDFWPINKNRIYYPSTCR